MPLLAGLLLCAAVLALFLFYSVLASRYDLKEVQKIPERSAVYDCDGRFYTRLAGENRVLVEYAGISPHFLNALLAREDTRFYRHIGVDPIGIARALLRNLVHGGIREGGSTITQQLALNTFLGGRHVRSLHRKLLEAFLAIRIEENFTKRQVLEFYANRIYFGAGMYGIETAARAYFGKPAARLTLGEGALLAGIIRSPNRFSPWKNLPGALRQRDAVLRRMAQLGMITTEQARAAMRDTPRVAPQPPGSFQENYALELVRAELDVILDDAALDEGGLRVFTTIDPRLQRLVEMALDRQLSAIERRPDFTHRRRGDPGALETGEGGPVTNYLQGAALVIDNRTGGIRAVAGGRNHAESRFNRALLAARPIGSTFKPFVYAAAFANGLQPDARIDDGPIRRGEVPRAPDWSPANSDRTNRGLLPAREGLVLSRNTMTVRVGERAGLAAVRRTAVAAGFQKVPALPAIYLGGFEATLRDLTAAYTVFPNEGIRRQCYLIERIEDADGRTIFRSARIATRALDPGVCRTLNGILAEVLTRGTAHNARALGLAKAACGKTGTTDACHDAWFVGYTRSLTCGVWVGFDKPRTILPEGYGAVLALPAWVEIINGAPAKRYPAGDLPTSSGPTGSDQDSLRNLWRHLFKR